MTSRRDIPQAVLFDFDGTIIDTETPGFESHARFFAEHGVPLSVEQWCTCIGTIQSDTHWFDWLCARTESPPTYEHFKKRIQRYYREHLRLEPMPGIVTLLDELARAGIPAAIASNAPRGWVTRSLDRVGLRTRFAAIVTSDQVHRGKPDPEVYLEAARRVRANPAACVAVEDSGPGLAAARAAGMKTVVIPHALNRTHDLTGADLTAATASELSLAVLCRLI